MEVVLVPIDWLKAHEQIRPKKVDELAEVTKKWGCYTKPLLVDSRTGAILDGHHRHQVGLILKLRRLPVILFDYMEDNTITVEAWPNCGFESLSKKDVIDMAESDQLYPPKTSRHTIEWNAPPIHVSLEILSKAED